MLAGHLGVALAIKADRPRINLGMLCFASLFLDFVLWTLVLLGVEQVIIPADYSTRHYLMFVFPYSHGLLASLAWSAAAGAIAALLYRGLGRTAAFLWVGAAVFSHFLLDAFVHIPEMPVAGPGSAKLGLGLWNSRPIALSLELILTFVGLAFYLRRSALTRLRKAVVIGLVFAVAAFTAIGLTAAPAPPGPVPVAVSSLLLLAAVVAAFWWADRSSTAPPGGKPGIPL